VVADSPRAERCRPGRWRPRCHGGQTPPSLDGHEDQRRLASPELSAAPESSLSSANPRLIKLDLASERLRVSLAGRRTMSTAIKLREVADSAFFAATA
jgi:hypothetical protein